MYFRPTGFKKERSYYSLTYRKAYYDGYGFNFYYGNYGYYENSKNDIKVDHWGWISWVLLLIGFFGILFAFYKFLGWYDKKRIADAKKKESGDKNDIPIKSGAVIWKGKNKNETNKKLENEPSDDNDSKI